MANPRSNNAPARTRNLGKAAVVPYILVVAVAILNILSLTCFKTGLTQAGGIGLLDLANPRGLAHKFLTTPLLLVGVGTSVTTTLLWLATLTRLSANVAVPLMNGIFYVLLLAVSVTVLGESLGIQKVVAIVLIFGGVALLI
jgi:drug/metabolite transporter (DMT)-like permease